MRLHDPMPAPLRLCAPAVRRQEREAIDPPSYHGGGLLSQGEHHKLRELGRVEIIVRGDDQRPFATDLGTKADGFDIVDIETEITLAQGGQWVLMAEMTDWSFSVAKPATLVAPSSSVT